MPPLQTPDGETVKNKLGATSQPELEAIEVDFVKAQQIEHAFKPRIARTFDVSHLTAIHRQLFQDVYHWAGGKPPLAAGQPSVGSAPNPAARPTWVDAPKPTLVAALRAGQVGGRAEWQLWDGNAGEPSSQIGSVVA